MGREVFFTPSGSATDTGFPYQAVNLKFYTVFKTLFSKQGKEFLEKLCPHCKSIMVNNICNNGMFFYKE